MEPGPPHSAEIFKKKKEKSKYHKMTQIKENKLLV
jgi:hypothetical protein